MWSKKRGFSLSFLLLLVIVLQGMIPFLHAHTGISSLTGVHAPDLMVSHHQVYDNAKLQLASKSTEESFAVQVGSEL